MKRLVALLLLIPLVGAQSVSDDGPNLQPPTVEPPPFTVDADDVMAFLEIDLTGFTAGDKIITSIGGMVMSYQWLTGGDHLMVLSGANRVQRIELPPNASDDVTLQLSMLSLVIDRVGDNPVDATKLNIVDGSLPVQGMLTSLGNLGADGPVTDPTSFTKTGAGTVGLQRFDLLVVEDVISTLVAIDPDNELLLGSLADHTSQVPTTDTAYSTAGDIQTALSSLAVTSLELDTVLSNLFTATEALGAVDVEAVAAALPAHGLALHVVELPVPDPKTILDSTAGIMYIVDGGAGDITLLADEKKLAIDNELLNQLKDEGIDAKTVLHYVDGDTISRVEMDPRIGDYELVNKKFIEAVKRGVNVGVVPVGTSCKDVLASTSDLDLCDFPTAPTVDPKIGSMISELKVHPITGPNLDLMGTATGLLKDFPAAPSVDPVGIFGHRLPGLERFTMPTWDLPDFGLGAIPEYTVPNPDAVAIPDCDGPCLPEYSPNVLDAIFEGFPGGFLPTKQLNLPSEALSGFGALITDSVGNGVNVLPVDVVEQLPLGATAEFSPRIVGGKGSVWSGLGISDATVVLQVTDALGISTSTYSLTTNTNGFASTAVPALGTWKLTAEKTGHETVQGGGQSPPPGGEASPTYRMSASGEDAISHIINNSGYYGGGLLLLALVAILVMRGKKRRQGKGASRRIA